MQRNLCCDVNVSSKNHQGFVNEPALKHQWLKVFTTKTIKIKKLATEFINVSNMSLQRIINDHRWSSKETSMFRRSGQKKKHFWSLIFATNSLLQLQWFFKEPSTNRRWSSNKTSLFLTLAQWKIIIINVCIEIIRILSKIFIGSSPNNQSSSKGTSTFW